MSTSIVDAPLLDRTNPALARPLPAGLAVARADVIAASRDLHAIPEAALTRPWAWIGGSEEEVRYGAYRAAEALELAEVEARGAVSAADLTEGRAARIIAPSTAARWDLRGLMMPLDERLLDADPGGGEWSVRLTMGHIIASQRGFAWGTAWWLSQGLDRSDPALPTGAPASFWAAQPDESTTEAAGTVEELLARLDTIVDLTGERLAGLPDESVDIGGRWAGFAVTLGFRLGRLSSHIREHSIQVEKTLAMVGHVPTEPARLIRNMLAAYGRAESAVFGREGVDLAVDRVVRGAAEARQAIQSAREAASV